MIFFLRFLLSFLFCVLLYVTTTGNEPIVTSYCLLPDPAQPATAYMRVREWVTTPFSCVTSQTQHYDDKGSSCRTNSLEFPLLYFLYITCVLYEFYW